MWNASGGLQNVDSTTIVTCLRRMFEMASLQSLSVCVFDDKTSNRLSLWLMKMLIKAVILEKVKYCCSLQWVHWFQIQTLCCGAYWRPHHLYRWLALWYWGQQVYIHYPDFTVSIHDKCFVSEIMLIEKIIWSCAQVNREISFFTCKYLGIWLDDRLSFKVHIENLVKKLKSKIAFFYFYFLNKAYFNGLARKKKCTGYCLSVLNYGWCCRHACCLLHT